MSPSVNELQYIVYMCEQELIKLDLLVNVKKSCCMRIGKWHDTKCASILCADGMLLDWVDSIRYLGVFIVAELKMI